MKATRNSRVNNKTIWRKQVEVQVERALIRGTRSGGSTRRDHDTEAEESEQLPQALLLRPPQVVSQTKE